MSINREHDERTRKDRRGGALIAPIILLWTMAFCSTDADAADVTIPCSVPTTSIDGKTVVLRADGVAIPDPAGVLFSYGTAPDQLVKNWRIANYKNCTVTITGLDGGKTYYFAAKFYTLSGEYSALSNEVSIAAPLAALPVPVLGTPAPK